MTTDTPAGGRPNRAEARRIKKSETLEVRIPHETKQAFLNACREDGTTASEVVREGVQTYLDTRERPKQAETKRTFAMKLPEPVRRYGLRAAIGGAAAVGLVGLAAVPSAAAPDIKAQFSRLDINKDGVLSEEEFLGPKPRDGNATEDVVVESHVVTRTEASDGPPPTPGTPFEMKTEAFTFWLPEELGDSGAGPGPGEQHEYKFIARSEVKTVKDGEAPPPAAHAFSFSVDDMLRKEFRSIDSSGDGKVSLEEYQARQTAMLTRGFEILDADGDQTLNLDEYSKIVGPPTVKLNWQGAGDPPNIPKIDVPGVDASPEKIRAAFTRLDANKDGKLSLREYLPAS